MEIGWWVVFGVVAGLVAKLVMDGPNAGDIAVAIPLGIIGALAGGTLHAITFNGTALSFDFGSLMIGSTGAILMLCCNRCHALRALA